MMLDRQRRVCLAGTKTRELRSLSRGSVMRKFLSALLFVAASVFLTLAASGQTASPLLLRYPTVSKTQIVFNYGDDLWIVSRDGGDARQLTSGIGIETVPAFSPDGTLVAFTGEYDGNR